MAAAANTQDVFETIGIREDLSEVISRIDPVETPFQSNVGKMSINNTYFEWQTQSLASSNATNAHIQGDITAATAITPTARVGNRTQISKKVCTIADTVNAVSSAGRANDTKYNMILKGLELKRDMEARSVGNYASVAGNATTAAQTGGLQAWCTSNISAGSGGSGGGFGSGVVAAMTGGTDRTYTEALLKSVHQSVYESGGKASMLMMSPTQKTVFSGFAGLSSTRVNNPEGQTKIIGGADVYVGDFGTLTATVNLFQDADSAILVDTSKAKIATLRPMKQRKLAKTGDAEVYDIVCEWGLMVENEAAMGVIADLT